MAVSRFASGDAGPGGRAGMRSASAYRIHVQRPKRGPAMATYGTKASDKVDKTMHERKAGTLKSGTSGKRVMSKKQAIGIRLPEARSGLRQSAAQKLSLIHISEP